MKKQIKERKAGNAYDLTQEADRQDMLERLETYRAGGCRLALGGKTCYPQAIVNACFREQGSYMADFIADEHDRIRAINYIHIKHS